MSPNVYVCYTATDFLNQIDFHFHEFVVHRLSITGLQEIKDPAHKSQYCRNFIELACSVCTGKILVSFLFCKFMDLAS